MMYSNHRKHTGGVAGSVCGQQVDYDDLWITAVGAFG